MTRASRLAPRLRALRLAALIALGACRSATDTGTPLVDLMGDWRYTGAQSSPASATLDGTLAVTQQGTQRLDGTADVLETDAQGRLRRLGGVVAGRTPDATSVDFDVMLQASVRRHVGRITADTIAGSWIELSDDGSPTASGTFRAVRGATP